MSEIKFNTSIIKIAENQTCESRQNVRAILSETFKTDPGKGTFQTENLPVIPFNPETSKLTAADEPNKQPLEVLSFEAQDKNKDLE